MPREVDTPVLAPSPMSASPAAAAAAAAPLIAARIHRVLPVCEGILFVVPCIVLFGWAVGDETLKRVNPSFVAMNPTTALCFLACGTSLGLQRREAAGRKLAAALLLAGAVTVIGFIKAQGFFTGWDGGIDRLLFGDASRANPMAPNTAVAFVLFGFALLSLDVDARRHWRPAQLLALAAGAPALLAVLGYAYATSALYGVSTFVPMAFHSAACFLVLAVGVLAARPSSGVMALVTSDSDGGILARRLLLASVLIPGSLGWLCLLGLRGGHYDPAMGISLLVVCTVVVFSTLIWLTAGVLHRVDVRRHAAEAALAGERDLLRALIDNLPDHIYVKDRDGRYVTDNAAHARFAGRGNPAEIIGKTSFDLFPPEIAQRFVDDDRAVIESGQALVNREEPIVAPDGGRRWVSTTKVPLRDRAGAPAGLVGISRDVTHRKQVEQEMREMQDFLSSIVENVPAMLFVKEANELRFVRHNKAGEDLLGVPREKLLGKNDYDCFPKEEADRFTANDRAVLASGKLLDIPAEPIDTAHGVRVLHTKKIPIVIDGQPRYLLGISEDITDRIRAERQLREQNERLARMAASERAAREALAAAQSGMVQAEKLASLGQLVAGVAHEINNPLSFVSNNVAVLQRDVGALRELLALYAQADAILAAHDAPLMARVRELAGRIDLEYTFDNVAELTARSREGLRRIQQIVKDLRDFARLDESDLHEVDLNAGVESTVNILRGRAKHKAVELELKLTPLPAVSCYPAKINQVVMNLVANAIDACAANGHVTITTSADDHSVKIEVTDDGPGIAPEVRDRIFDPFFTTKPQGEGTGLGLSISYGIIRDHHGRIDVDSTPGRGARFTVTLPLRPFDPAAAAAAAAALAPADATAPASRAG